MMSSPRLALLAVLLLVSADFAARAQPRTEPYRGPVIDMHLHAQGAGAQGPPPVGVCLGIAGLVTHDPSRPYADRFMDMLKQPPCEAPIWSPETDEELQAQTFAALERLDVIGVLSGPRDRVAAWKKRAPERIIAGHQFQLSSDAYSPEDLASYFDAGGFEVLAEVTNQYAGIAADDARFAEYWRVAAEKDIPVGIHIGTGPPGAPYLSSGYRARLHSPLALEPILNAHPGLRVYVMHAAWPMRDEMKAMLYAYPHLYVGTGVLQLALPRAEYHDFLADLVRSGFDERIMFGSDQMVWPELIEEGIRAINEAPFLSYEQKKAILHDNAARFLRRQAD